MVDDKRMVASKKKFFLFTTVNKLTMKCNRMQGWSTFYDAHRASSVLRHGDLLGNIHYVYYVSRILFYAHLIAALYNAN